MTAKTKSVKKPAKRKYKKRAKKAKKPAKKKTVKKAVKKSKANWGANETPRHCRNQNCKSIHSEVMNTVQKFNPERTLRYRLCKDCGQKYTTIEAV